MYAALSLKVVAVYFNFYGHRDLALSIVWAPVCPVLLQPTWILSWDEILAMIRGHRAHNPRSRKENKAPRLELTLYNVYITAHGVRVIRSECSNTKSAHFQLNNEIALKRDRWVFVLCQVKKVWVNRNIEPKVVTSIFVGQSKELFARSGKESQIFTACVTMIIMTCDIVTALPVTGGDVSIDHWHWCLLRIFFTYSTGIIQYRGPHTGPWYQWHLNTRAHNSYCHSREVHIKHVCKE